MYNASTINIAAFAASPNLATRQIARELIDSIAHMKEKQIILDFTETEYASRSFFDELNAAMSHFAQIGKSVELHNLSPDLEKLHNFVSESARSNRSLSYASVANAEVITM
jgi:hypothetical protein